MWYKSRGHIMAKVFQKSSLNISTKKSKVFKLDNIRISQLLSKLLVFWLFSVGCMVWTWLRLWVCQDICQILMRYKPNILSSLRLLQWVSTSIGLRRAGKIMGNRLIAKRNRSKRSIDLIISYSTQTTPYKINLYTRAKNVWSGWFLTGNHDSHENWVPSILHNNLCLISMKQKNIFFHGF